MDFVLLISLFSHTHIIFMCQVVARRPILYPVSLSNYPIFSSLIWNHLYISLCFRRFTIKAEVFRLSFLNKADSKGNLKITRGDDNNFTHPPYYYLLTIFFRNASCTLSLLCMCLLYQFPMWTPPSVLFL
jgi:hypothetical protein